MLCSTHARVAQLSMICLKAETVSKEVGTLSKKKGSSMNRLSSWKIAARLFHAFYMQLQALLAGPLLGRATGSLPCDTKGRTLSPTPGHPPSRLSRTAQRIAIHSADLGVRPES